jgi:hypothetical protein
MELINRLGIGHTDNKSTMSKFPSDAPSTTSMGILGEPEKETPDEEDIAEAETKQDERGSLRQDDKHPECRESLQGSLEVSIQTLV